MKVALVGVTGVPLGKQKVKDPRLDQADKLVKPDNKTYASVDVVGAQEASTADALVASPEGRFDLIVQDLEFAEIRLQRNPLAAERAVLKRIKAHLEGEGVVAEEADVAAFDNFLVRVVHASRYISFLTVGGSENRAWLIRKGATAQEAGGAIHTDLQRGFIRAEIIGYDDFVAAGGEVLNITAMPPASVTRLRFAVVRKPGLRRRDAETVATNAR